MQCRLRVNQCSGQRTRTLPSRSSLMPPCRSRKLVTKSLAFQVDIRKVKDVFARATDATWDDRLATLKRFYTELNRATAEQLLDPDFHMYAAGHDKKFSRDDYLTFLYDRVLPAIPDFQWCSATNNEIDGDGYVVVTVRASGHHTGQPFELPGLPAIPPSGKHFCLEEEAQMVRVDHGKVKDIKVFLVPHTGPLALYTALGGKAPTPKSMEESEEHLPMP